MIKSRYISRRFDEATILAVMAKIAFSPEQALEEGDYAVLAALRRSSEDWQLPLDQTADRLATYSDEQISGLVSNVKGILHEMEFVQLENSDGDAVFAAQFPDTNHKGVDVQMTDTSSGDTWAVQLKSTDDSQSIMDWMDSNPDSEILVSEELAEKMDIPDSGFSNEDMTMRVEDFVDKMISLQDEADESLWDYFPPLVAVSAGIIVFELWRRYRTNLITFEQFKWLTLKTLGLKAGKYVALLAAMGVPGLNVVVGAYLLGALVLAITDALDDAPNFKPFSFLGRTTATADA